MKRAFTTASLLVAVALSVTACGGTTSSTPSASASGSTSSSAYLTLGQACAQVNQLMNGITEEQFGQNLTQVAAKLSTIAASTTDATLQASLNSAAAQINAGANAATATASANPAEQSASVERWYRAIQGIEASCGGASPSASN